MRYFFFSLMLLWLASCSKNEFTLDFQLSTDVTDNFSVTYYASDVNGGITIQAVASVRDGKCVLNGVTKLPTLLYVTARKSPAPLVIYAKKGDKILVEGMGADPLAWNVEAGEVNEALSSWRKENLETLTQNIPDSINTAVRNFVEENPENPASAILMLCYFHRGADERGYSQLMASLKGMAKETEWVRLAARSDQLYPLYSYPARLESMVMRSMNDGADTLKTDGKNPVMMMFWQTGYSERKSLIDSIKVLRKEFPDSVRIIADVCLDADSVGWRNAIRKDSLEDIKRFWTPVSLADPTIMKLKVKSLPYFIVFDSIGQQTYSGGDLKLAMQDYRRLLTSQDTIK